MPVRSVVKIDVQDQKWRQFEESFTKYDSALRKQPELWEKVSKEHSEMAKSFDRFASAQSRMVDSARSLSSHWKDTAQYVGTMGSSAVRTLAGIESKISSVLSTIGRATGVGAILGLAGMGGGLYGLERLASTVGSGRRYATGVGAGYGSSKALGMTYDRVVNSGAVLGGVNAGTGDITSGASAAMYALGMDPSAGGDNAATAQQVIQRVHGLVRGQSRGMVGAMGSAYGLGELGFSLEDLQRLRSTSSGELGQFSKEFTGRSGMFHVPPATQKAFQDFSIKLSEAGQKIETGLVKILGKPEFLDALNKMSDAFSDFVLKILGSQGAVWAVDQVTKGLKWLGDYLTGGDAKKDWDDLMKKIGEVGDALAGFADFVNRWFGSGAGPAGGAQGTAGGYLGSLAGAGATLPQPSTAAGLDPRITRNINTNRWEDYVAGLAKMGQSPTITKEQWLQGMNTGSGGSLSEFQKNNYAGIMQGDGKTLQGYASSDDAIKAHGKLLQAYQSQRGQDTIDKVIRGVPGKDGKLYGGYSATHQDQYVAFLEKELKSQGIVSSRFDKLNLQDLTQLSALMSAQAKMENVAGRGRDPRYSPQAIKLVLENQTGGNVTTTATQMGYP